MSDKIILIAEDEEEIREILEMIIESEFDNPIILAESGNKAIKLIEEHSDKIGVIISDYGMYDGNGGVLYNFNKSNLNVPFFLISGGDLGDYEEFSDFRESNPLNTFISKPFEEDDLLSAIKNSLESSNQKLPQKRKGYITSPEAFRKIKLTNLVKFLHKNEDIYLKLSDDKYVKVIHKGELGNTNQLQKYIDKGEEFAFMMETDFKSFVSDTMDVLFKKADKATTKIDSLENLSETLDFLTSDLVKLGVTEGQIELINHSVQSCVDNFKNDEKMFKVLQNFFKEKGYLVAHSISALHIAHMISKQMSYHSETVLTKLTYSSMLHDITLQYSDLSAVLKKNDEKYKKLTEDQQKIVLDHPQEAVQFIAEFHDLPSEITHIVLEHHERPDGTGFPRGLTATRISPLGCIFILALEAADFSFYNEINPETVKKLKEKLKDYDQGNFRRPLEALLSTAPFKAIES